MIVPTHEQSYMEIGELIECSDYFVWVVMKLWKLRAMLVLVDKKLTMIC